MSEEIRSRLARLKRKIAENEAMVLVSCLTEAEVAAFEERNGVRLPEEYRLLLTEVGNGVEGRGRRYNSVDSSGVLGIYPLDFWLDDAPGMPMGGNIIRGDLSQPFPLSEAVDYERNGYPEDHEEQADSTLPGKVFVCHEGCGIYWVLVVNGAERGNMWVESEFGYFPSNPRIGLLDWLDRWVETGWSDGLQELTGSPDDE